MPSRAATRGRVPSAFLAVTVFVAAGVAGVADELLGLAARGLPVGVGPGAVLAGTLGRLLHGLVPFAFVALAFGRRDAPSLPSVGVVAVGSLAAGVAGRYLGTALGALVRGRGVPSPLVLVGPADFAVGGFGPVMWTVSVLGVVAAGLWALLGAFAGVGLLAMVGRVG
ncbi:hypothetical protein [Halobaculum sp. EA56]|uniref:hypothetical protein n=1 Tax=Halobaculum sp. EA56 TaxID=3421648 RepID=UPI003EB9A404